MDNIKLSRKTIHAIAMASARMFIDGDQVGSMMVMALIPPDEPIEDLQGEVATELEAEFPDRDLRLRALPGEN